jgi:hypothetical protein
MSKPFLPAEIRVEFTDATKVSAPFWTVNAWGRELVFRSLSALTGWLSKHDYRYVLDSFGVWRLPR